jgi:hypothetical protein
MDSHKSWTLWANRLNQWGLKEPVAVFIEAAGPLSVFAAQLVYFGQPFFSRLLSLDHSTELASMLENGKERQSFVSFLREEHPE